MSVRSKDQLAVMLKLIDVNKVSLTRKNLSVRQRVWQVITYKLNQMQGAEKDMDGWKRSYYTWRLNAGSDYDKEMQRIIKDMPDDDYYYINIGDEESRSENDGDDIDEATLDNPTERQRMRLHELVSKHRQILQSSADDEPLKTRVWLNITEELNSIKGAPKLTPNEWKQRVDWSKYYVRRGRKRKNNSSTALREPEQKIAKNIKFDVIDNSTMDSHSVDLTDQEYEDFAVEETAAQQSSTQEEHQEIEQAFDIDFVNTDDEHDDDEDTDKLLDDDDDDINSDNYNINEPDEDDDNYNPHIKRVRPTPIIKSFKNSNRIVNAVERLSSDVKDIKEVLKQTTNTLACLENVLQQHCRKQDETNALLKRNGQLLKILIEYKHGRRTNNISK